MSCLQMDTNKISFDYILGLVSWTKLASIRKGYVAKLKEIKKVKLLTCTIDILGITTLTRDRVEVQIHRAWLMIRV